MISRRFYKGLIFRLILLMASYSALHFVFDKNDRLFSLLGAGLFIILLFLESLRYLNRFNQKAGQFFQLVSTGIDKDQVINEDELKSFPEWRNAYSNIRGEILKIQEQEKQERAFSESIIQNASVGILVYDANSEIRNINPFARQLLGVENISHLSELNQLELNLENRINNLQIGSNEVYHFKLLTKNKKVQFSKIEFKLQDRTFYILFLNDIHSEIQKTELSSYQRIIQVLTHELMNSLTPIRSQIQELREQNNSQNNENTAIFELEQRFEQLISFSSKFRKFGQELRLKKEYFPVAEVLYQAVSLFQDEARLKPENISIDCFPIDLHLFTDKNLLLQVLINLIKNSLEAKNRFELKLSIKAINNSLNEIHIKIKDNGKGMTEEEKQQALIPFFTSKETGTGIGLSLAHQFMIQQAGEIQIESDLQRGTSINLIFKNQTVKA